MKREDTLNKGMPNQIGGGFYNSHQNVFNRLGRHDQELITVEIPVGILIFIGLSQKHNPHVFIEEGIGDIADIAWRELLQSRHCLKFLTSRNDEKLLINLPKFICFQHMAFYLFRVQLFHTRSLPFIPLLGYPIILSIF